MSIHYVKPNEIFLVDHQIVLPHRLSKSLDRSPACRYSLCLFHLQDCKFLHSFTAMALIYPLIQFHVVNLTKFPEMVDVLAEKPTESSIPMILLLKNHREIAQFDHHSNNPWNTESVSEWFVNSIPLNERYISFI